MFPNYHDEGPDFECLVTYSFIMTRSSYPNSRPKMTRTRAPKTSTTMCAITSYIIISILKQLCITNPYDLLPIGTVVAIEHASSAQAEKIEPSSLCELNTLMHLMHPHHKGTWTRDNRLLRLSLPQPWRLLPYQRHSCHRRLCQHHQRHPLLLWARDVHTPSLALTTPTQVQRLRSYTTKQYRRLKRNSMGKPTTWLSSS